MLQQEVVIVLLITTLLLIGCSGAQIEEPEAPAPIVGPVIPFGPSEVRDLAPTTETVPNCGGGGGTIVKHPSITVITSHLVEWEVGGEVGIGVTIGEGVIPGGVDFSSALDTHVTSGNESGIQQSTAWDLPAEPNMIMEYTLMWREIWQPGYIDVRLADQRIIRVNVRYRTGIESDIIGQRQLACDGGQVTPLQPTQVAEATLPLPVPTAAQSPQPIAPIQFLSQDRVPPDGETTLSIQVDSGTIHIITSGPICVDGTGRCLSGGEKRGSVVVLLPRGSPYVLTGLVPTQNWHGGYEARYDQWQTLAETTADGMKVKSSTNVNCTGGCDIVDILVVSSEGVVTLYNK